MAVEWKKEDLDQQYAPLTGYKVLEAQVQAKMEVVEARKGELLSAFKRLEDKMTSMETRMDAGFRASDSWVRLVLVTLFGVLMKIVFFI